MLAGESPSEAGLLSQCPACVYSLVGLEVQHRCPECGFEFDRRWRVFGGPILAADRGRFLRSNILWMALVGPMFVTVSTVGLYQQIWAILLLPLFVSAVLFAIFSWPPRKFIVVGSEGVQVYRGRACVARFAWLEIRSARHDVLRKAIRLELTDRSVFIATYPVVRANLAEADACARAIVAAKAEQAAA